jgi:hypothetical protein
MRIPNFPVSAFLNYTNATILIPNGTGRAFIHEVSIFIGDSWDAIADTFAGI